MKKCPFCGGTAEVITTGYGSVVKCNSCGATGSYKDTEGAAERAWDKRSMEQLEGKDLGKLTGFAVNSYGFSNKDFCAEMAKEHRTIQQNYTRLVFEWIKTCANMEYFDPRNEASVMACRKLQEVIENEDIGLPFV